MWLHFKSFFILLANRWNTETEQPRGEKNTASQNLQRPKRRNLANQHQSCEQLCFVKLLGVYFVFLVMFKWLKCPFFSCAVTMSSPLKTALTVTILGTKCCRPWDGRRVKVSVATSRASLHQLRYSQQLPGSVRVYPVTISINNCI